MTVQKAKRITITRRKCIDQMTSYLFIAPFLLLFSVFVLIPIFQAAYTSLTYDNLIQPASFIGFTNYRVLLTNDDVFITAMSNTLIFAFVVGLAGYALSFLLAWLINMFKMRVGFSLAFYAPSLTSGVAMSVVWKYFFSNDRYGLFNDILFDLGLIDSPILWLSDSSYILPVVMFVSLWMSMGNGFLVFLAGLQNVPGDILEAGQIDGVRNKIQELCYIVLPTMKPQLLFGAVNTVVSSFAVFDIAVSLVGMPSPNYAAHTIVAHLFDKAFIRFEMGYASAIAMFLFFFTFVISRILMRLLASDD